MWETLITNQKIGTRLFAAISIPMVIVVGFASHNLYKTYVASAQIAKIHRLASFSPDLTNLVHELQKERGASAGFIGSKADNSFAKKLIAQQKATDIHLAKFNKATSSFNSKSYGSEFSSRLSAAEKSLADLKNYRSSVLNLAFSLDEMTKHYTITISNLLETVAYMAILSPDTHLSNQITAYTSFLQAKERAGQERAVGTAGFSAGRFLPQTHKKFSALVAKQNAYLGMFIYTATQAQVSFYKKTMDTDIVSKVLKMRFIGVSSAYSPSSEKLPITGPEWFDAMTQKIDLLKKVENRLSSDIVTYTTEQATAYQQWFYTFLATIIIVLALTTMLVTKVAQSIIHPIKGITSAMDTLSNGDTNICVDSMAGTNEIGDMAKAICIFRNNELEKRVLEIKSIRQAANFEEDKATHAIRQLAQTMEEMNSVALNLGVLDNHSVKVSGSSQTIASAAEELVASVDEISLNSEGAASDAAETDSTVTEGRTSAQDAMSAIQIIWDTMEDSVESLEELTGASDQIEQILNVIEDIAEQTNLLALNATIEAARAGEAGKGFAVVASEVKNLANQSSKATEDIATRIQSLKAGMENISATMNKSREAVTAGRGSIEQTAQTMDLAAQQVTSVSSKMNDITSILHQQKGSSSEIAKSITEVAEFAMESQKQVEQVVARMATTNDIMSSNAHKWFDPESARSLCEIAKIDHILFKKDVINAVTGRTQMNSAEISDHHNCRLGIWYDALNVAHIKNAPAFRDLAEPHRIVHAAAKKALEATEDKRYDEAFEAVDEMNKAGTETLQILGRLSDLIANHESDAQQQKAS